VVSLVGGLRPFLTYAQVMDTWRPPEATKSRLCRVPYLSRRQYRSGTRAVERPATSQLGFVGGKTMEIRPYAEGDEESVVQLWERCGLTRPWNDPRNDIARKRAVRPDLFLVGVVDGEIIGTVMAGYEGHRGWINYLAVAPEQRRHGWGRALMTEAERLLLASGCPKINLQVRGGNIEALAFYEKIGFLVDEVVSLGKRLIPDGRAPT
jgi:ribosomal protein S18 acetylase RimI-like enzyme